MRTLLSVLVILLLGTAWADDPPANQSKPPYERLLQGDDEKTAATLEKRIADLEKADQYAEAVQVAEELAALRARVQGADHWKSRDARIQVRTLQKSMTLPAAARAQLREATQATQVANDYHAQGKYADAQPLFKKALAIRRQAFGEQRPLTATAYNNLAANLDAQGKYADAQPLFKKALAIWRRALGEQHFLSATDYNNLAHALDAQGKYAEAQPLFEKALAICRKALGEQHPLTATAYHNLAYNLAAHGKYAAAFATLERASRSYETSRLAAAHGLERSVALRSPYPLQAALLARRDRPREAWEALQHDLARGLLDEQAGRRESIFRPNERTLRTTLTQRLAVIRPRFLYLLTQPERSKAEQQELGDLIGKQRQLDADFADLAAALSQREVATLDEIREVLPADAALVAWIDLSLPGIEEHWACVLRSSGDPAWEHLPGSGTGNQWTKQDTALPGRLRFALAGDKTTAPASATEVAARARAVYAQRLAPLDKHLQGVQRLYVVPVGAMAGVPVEVLSERYQVSYVPSGTFLARLQGRPRPAGDRGLALGDPRFDADPAKLPSAPQALPSGGLLVTQVLPSGNAAAARIAPQDVLLIYAGADLKDVGQLAKLIPAHAGDKAVAVTVWRDGKTALRQLAPGRLGVVLAKDPAPQALAAKYKTDQLLASLHGGAWKELPGTRVELARLAQLFGNDKVTLLADVGATEPALEALRTGGRLKEFRYLHFATHGEANDVQALESRLILTQDAAARAALPHSGQPTLDGQLSAREVLEFWDLDAELVTLSACETALGRPGGGDGLLGFAQAFLTAGSRAVCLSLWRVDDTATALLMDRFYQNLTGQRPGLKAPLGRAEALAEAKQWLRTLSPDEAAQRLGAITAGVARGKGQQALNVVPPAAEAQADPKAVKPFAHPKYWAAFVLIGDPD